jgi:hypothetical protein
VGVLRGLAALVACCLVACAHARPPDPPPRDDPPWTLIVLPDTQQYTYLYPEIWYAQTDWIAAHAAEHNVRFIAHVGDVTEWNTAAEWDVASRGLADLHDVAPLVLVPGNHDYDVMRPRASGLTTYWPVEDFMAWPTYGGLFEADRTDNTFQTFEVNGEPWLVLGLEWGPRAAVLAWAAAVLDDHPAHRAIIVTHAYLYLDNRRYDWARRGDAQRFNPHSYVGTAWPDVTDGEEIWQTVIAPRDNVELVVSGHVPDEGVGRQSSMAAGGHVVHEVMADFQSGPMGGNGYLRLMTFHNDRIEVRTYSPFLDRYETSSEHEFVLPWRP